MKHGLIYRILFTLLYPWISRVRILTAEMSTFQNLQKEGRLIFVGNAASLIDYMVVNDQLTRKGLQPLGFTHGINPFLVLPFTKAWSLWTDRLFKSDEDCMALDREEIRGYLSEGRSGMIFLKKGYRLYNPTTKRIFDTKMSYYHDFFGPIGEDALKRGDRLFLVPTSVFLTRARKKNSNRTAFDIFFGTYDIPGPLRKLYQLLWNYQKGGTVFSKHIDLKTEMERVPKMSTKALDKRFRWTLMFHLNNEDRAYRGPTKRTVDRKVRKILKERRLNEELKRVAERQNRSFDSVYKEADRTLREIASDTSERVINLLRIFFDFVWARTLEGIDVKQEDLDRIRELDKKGPVVFLPCHRSHVDYLAVAYLFEKKGLHYPRIAAGDNLSKWPLGPILRRAGAFFLRRSFKGEAVFPLVFDAYLRHVLRERHVLLFFMEGGRSRTGKLLHPKLGMMNMVVDAWRQGIVDDLPLVPVTIDYGRVFEGDAYLREKGGLEKQKENLASVIRSRKVLKRKHGIMRVRFAEPIYLKDYVSARGYTPETLGFKAKIPLVNELSFDILNRINGQVTLTAGNIIAAILMGNPKRGMVLSRLKPLFIMSVRFLRHRGAEVTFTERKLEVAMENALNTFVESETIVRVEVGGETVVNIPESKRSEMEYYKNNGLHYILDLALLSLAARCLPHEERTLDNMQQHARDIYSVLTHEFLYQGEYPERELLEDALNALITIQGLSLNEENGRVGFGESEIGRDLVHISAHFLLNFLESYFVVAEVGSSLAPDAAVDKKQFLKDCMAKAKLLYAVGTISRAESLNHVTFSNALTHYTKGGLLRQKTIKGHKQPKISPNPDAGERFSLIRDRVFHAVSRLN